MLNPFSLIFEELSAEEKEKNKKSNITYFGRSCTIECTRMLDAFLTVVKDERIGFTEEIVDKMLRSTYDMLFKAYVLKVLDIVKGSKSGGITHNYIREQMLWHNSRVSWDSVVQNFYSEEIFTSDELEILQNMLDPIIKDMFKSKFGINFNRIEGDYPVILIAADIEEE